MILLKERGKGSALSSDREESCWGREKGCCEGKSLYRNSGGRKGVKGCRPRPGKERDFRLRELRLLRPFLPI
jgi:hypothetical protein